MTKILNQILFFLCQNQNIFFSNIENQNIFLEKNHTPPPFKLNGRSLSLSATLILLFSRCVIPRCFNFWTLFISCHSKVYSEHSLLFFFAIRMTSVFPGFSFTRSRLVLYCTTPSMACISVLGPSSTISSVHAGEATHVSPNFTPSVPIVRLLRIVLLYLLYKRVDNFAPCRIPYAMLILSVRLLSHLTLNVIPLYMLFIRDHISPSTPS